jgi:peptidoglycan/xylan/chitin deacetylase (PgdA/CDA1 family)
MKRFVALIAIALISLSFIPCSAHALSEQREIYLTFDDGPSRQYTPAILDVLKAHGVKATFFVVGKNVGTCGDIMRRMRREGHTIGAHCHEHVYARIYKSPQSFKTDLLKCIDAIQRALPGYKVRHYRFPGGSFTVSERYIRIVREMGLEIVDWNCVNGDTEIRDASEQEIMSAVISTSRGKRKAVVLMHDNKRITADTLDAIIKHFKDKGYIFRKFT